MSAMSRASWRGFSRAPTRVRLTLAFAVTMVVVLAFTGLFVYVRFRSELDRTIDLNLRTQTAALVPVIVGSEAGLPAAADAAVHARADGAAYRRLTPVDRARRHEHSRPGGPDRWCDAR